MYKQNNSIHTFVKQTNDSKDRKTAQKYKKRIDFSKPIKFKCKEFLLLT